MRDDLPEAPPQPGAWKERAACHEPNDASFYPDPDDEAAADPAKAICNGCRVKGQCRTYALENRIKDGVWGGMSERERKQHWRAARKRRNAPTPPQQSSGRCPGCGSDLLVVRHSMTQLQCLGCKTTWPAPV